MSKHRYCYSILQRKNPKAITPITFLFHVICHIILIMVGDRLILKRRYGLLISEQVGLGKTHLFVNADAWVTKHQEHIYYICSQIAWFLDVVSPVMTALMILGIVHTRILYVTLLLICRQAFFLSGQYFSPGISLKRTTNGITSEVPLNGIPMMEYVVQFCCVAFLLYDATSSLQFLCDRIDSHRLS